jgi:hypothetical protein
MIHDAVPTLPRPRLDRRRTRLLRLQTRLEGPMLLLALVWTALFVHGLVGKVAAWEAALASAIWAAFLAEFSLRLWLAPRKGRFLAHNWLTLLALAAPGFRVLRVVRLARLVQARPIVSSLTVVRGLGSGRRLWSNLNTVQGPAPEKSMAVSLLAAASRDADVDGLRRFAAQAAEDIRPQLEAATGLSWTFRETEPVRLASDSVRPVADFVDEAALALAQGPFDLALVVTDVRISLRGAGAVAGAASPTARVAVISTRSLTGAGRDTPARALDAAPVRWNAASQALDLLTQALGVTPQRRRPAGASGSRGLRDRPGPPTLTAREREALAARAKTLPERELHGGDVVTTLVFHVLMALRHPGQVMRPLWRNGAFFLPLALPGLATAAVAPAYVLIFGAEIWDVGFGMSTPVAAAYAVASVLSASLYLGWAQDLFLPRRDKRVLTEHLAVANVVIYGSVLAASIGLFVMVGGLMFAIMTLIMPAGLMQTWPTLKHGTVTLGDKIRLAAFIATVGVTTGALAGGLESRAVIRRLALFEPEARRSAR